MTTITDKYIDNLYDLTQIQLPESAIFQAKKCLLDYLGVTFAGAKMLEKKGNSFLELTANQRGYIRVIGFNRKSNLYNAAMINGMSAHIAELDDGSRQGGIHLGAPIISAILPIIEQYKLNGKDLLKGIIVGYEAAIRLASAIQTSHRNKGYHATGTCGTIGVALATGAALCFNKQQMKDALSAAATSASGMLNVTKGSSELKPFNAGQASVSGIMAAHAAIAGFKGSNDVLSGEWGFINMMTEKSNLSLLEKLPDDKLKIEMVYLKPYAACRHSHPAIEAALILKQKYQIDPKQIAEVSISTYHLATKGHDHKEIHGITEAKMSTPFSVAVALLKGKAGIDEYSEEMILDTQVKELTNKINVIADDNLTLFVPEKRVAIVDILTTNQKHFIYRVDLAKGEPEKPLSKDEIIEKFMSLSLFGGKSVQHADFIAKNIWNIENKMSHIITKL